MATYTLLSEKRDLALRAKKIRKSGFVPAVIFGHHMDPLGIKIKQDVATKFLNVHSTGTKVLLKIDGEEQLAIFKEIQRDPITSKIIHIDFQALTSGEKVKVSLPINYLNRDMLEQDAVLQEQLSEIEISTLPKFLVDHVNVDLSKFKLGDAAFVADLDISKDENIEVITHKEAQVFTITHAAKFSEELPEDEEEEEAVIVSESTEE